MGGHTEIEADIRVIAASNRDLQAEAQSGSFREDLFYRLNVMPLSIPALAERRDDIPQLVAHFSEDLALQEGCSPIVVPPETMALLCDYQWPGNIRELRNTIERLTILHAGETIVPARLPPEITDAARTQPAGAENTADAGTGGDSLLASEMAKREAECIREALLQSRGRKGDAASSLGISRHALKRRMQKLGLAGEDR